jgi:hypothetical protein
MMADSGYDNEREVMGLRNTAERIKQQGVEAEIREPAAYNLLNSKHENPTSSLLAPLRASRAPHLHLHLYFCFVY